MTARSSLRNLLEKACSRTAWPAWGAMMMALVAVVSAATTSGCAHRDSTSGLPKPSLTQAKRAYEARIDVCRTQENSAADGLYQWTDGLSENDVRAALPYLYLVRSRECLGDAADTFQQAVEEALAAPRINATRQRELNSFRALAAADRQELEQARANYHRLDQDVRTKIESMPLVQSPFDPVRALNAYLAAPARTP